MLPTDPSRYSSTLDGGKPRERDPVLGKGWQWASEWKVKAVPESGDDGWSYSWNFGAASYHAKMTPADFVRRRLWMRDLVYVVEKTQEETESLLADATQRRLELIASTALQELLAENAVPPEARARVLALLADVQMALNEEETKTMETAFRALQFLDLASAQKTAAAGVPMRVVCHEAAALRDWAVSARGRPTTNLLGDTATEAEMLKRARELDFRSSNALSVSVDFVSSLYFFSRQLFTCSGTFAAGSRGHYCSRQRRFVGTRARGCFRRGCRTLNSFAHTV